MLQALASLFGKRLGLAVPHLFGRRTDLAQGTVDPQILLAEADRLTWLTNWYDGLPIYAEAEQAATKAGNRRDAHYAGFGRLRGQMQTRPSPISPNRSLLIWTLNSRSRIASCGSSA